MGQEAQIIFDRARLNYLMPIAKEALEAKRKGRAGAKDRQELIDTVYLRHRASIAAAVAVVLRRAGRNVPRKALIAWLSLEQGVWPLVAELRCATGNDDAQLEPKRLLRLFPELFPGSRGPRRSPLSPRNE